MKRVACFSAGFFFWRKHLGFCAIWDRFDVDHVAPDFTKYKHIEWRKS